MTIEQIEKGRKLLDELNVWKARYEQCQNRSLAWITIKRNNCDNVCFDGTEDVLSSRFFHEVELKYSDLCEKQIELLTKELEEL